LDVGNDIFLRRRQKQLPKIAQKWAFRHSVENFPEFAPALRHPELFWRYFGDARVGAPAINFMLSLPFSVSKSGSPVVANRVKIL
jgi:hypothetical protein